MEIEEVKRTTLQDIADFTGVSKATVCRVMKNYAHVRPDVVKTVRKAVRKLGYRPDPALSALAKHRWNKRGVSASSWSIALVDVVPGKRDEETHTNRAALYTAYDKLAATMSFGGGYFHLGDFKSADELGRVLYHRGFDGAVVHVARPLTKWSFPWERFATVILGYDHPSHRQHSICSDWGGAVNLAWEKTIVAGRKNPAFLCFAHGHPHFDQQIFGAMCNKLHPALGGNRLTSRLFHYDTDFLSRSNARDIFARWFDRVKPDSIIDGNSVAIWWLKDLGIKVPEDVGYCSLMGSSRDMVNADGVQFSGISHRYDLQVILAVEKILSLLQLNRKGSPEVPLRSFVECDWEAISPISGLARKSSSKNL